MIDHQIYENSETEKKVDRRMINRRAIFTSFFRFPGKKASHRA